MDQQRWQRGFEAMDQQRWQHGLEARQTAWRHWLDPDHGGSLVYSLPKAVMAVSWRSVLNVKACSDSIRSLSEYCTVLHSAQARVEDFRGSLEGAQGPREEEVAGIAAVALQVICGGHWTIERRIVEILSPGKEALSEAK